jgi:sugar lactone lactonase YvrE
MNRRPRARATGAGRATTVELALDVRADLGEGPCWDPFRGALAWVDINRSELHFFAPETGQDEVVDLGQAVGAVAPRASGGLVLALRDGFGLLDSETSRLELVAPVERENPLNRMNDGKCDPQGRFWAGTTALDGSAGAGSLYRFDPERGAVRMLSNVTISNGLDWSPDGTTMYYADSATQRVDRFDWDGELGTISNRTPLIEIPAPHGMPDGLTVDAEGFLWVALWDGSTIRRYSPEGRLDRVVEVPVARVTSCAFGGDDLRDLYITSASVGLGEDELERQPHAGGLFRLRTDVSGRRPNLFAG